MVYERYHIDKNDLAVLPAEGSDHGAVILSKKGKRVKVQRHQTEIIKDSCDEYMESYDYVRQTIKEKFKYHQKVPIFVCPALLIYVFPTCSAANENVIWINAIHIDHKYKNPKNDGHTDIFFKCGTLLTVDVSLHTIKQQYERTYNILCEVTRAKRLEVELLARSRSRYVSQTQTNELNIEYFS